MMLAWFALSEKTTSSERKRELSSPMFAAYPEVKYSAAFVPTHFAKSCSTNVQLSDCPDSNRDPVDAMRAAYSTPSAIASFIRGSVASPR